MKNSKAATLQPRENNVDRIEDKINAAERAATTSYNYWVRYVLRSGFPNSGRVFVIFGGNT